MNIGQAARASGVSAKMIRYYEQTGLIVPADRTPSGYRDYADADVHVLRFVRRARDLGFAVAEIHDMLDLWRDKNRQSADVKQIAEARIKDLEAKIRSFQEMVDTLRSLVSCCHGDHRPDCPILQRLETSTSDEDFLIEPRSGAVERARPVSAKEAPKARGARKSS